MASPEDISVLSTSLCFPTSGKCAKNRLMKAPLTELLATWNPENLQTSGIPTKTLVNVYEKWGHGGYGMVMTGNVMVDERHLEGAGNIIVSAAVDNDERRDALRKMLEAARADGAIVIVQLNHSGPQTPDFINPHPYGPSDIQLKQGMGFYIFGKPVALTTEQVVTEVIEKHAYAAKVFADLKADGIEVNATHGFLLSQFLSKASNNRTDHYGNTFENRLQVLLDIYKAIREVVPESFIVGFKLNSLEFQADKVPVSDFVKVCKTLEECGCDFIQLTGGDMEQAGLTFTRESTRQREQYFTEFIREVSKALSKCVIYATGGFRTTRGMADAIRNGLTQGIGLGRPTTQEPDLARKILSGTVERTQKSLLDQLDFLTTKKASNTQIAQMGINGYSGDARQDIMDLSDKKIVDEYLKMLKRFEAEMNDRVKRGVPAQSVFKFYTSVVE